MAEHLRSRGTVRAPAAMAALFAVAMTAVSVNGPMAVGAAPASLCEGIDTDGMEDKQPVLLVHGWRSNPGTWKNAIEELVDPEDFFVAKFDYRHVAATEWVTHPDIGPKLASTIDCLFEESKAKGGPGDVIVVAHSMGGLATRCALATDCSGVPRRIATKVGLVYSLGTPHAGSQLRGTGVRSFFETKLGKYLQGWCLMETGADVCQIVHDILSSHSSIAFTAGSNELTALPNYPEGVSVRAAAGSFRLRIPMFGGVGRAFRLSYFTTPDLGDGVVSVESALAESTDDALGGTMTITCPENHWAGCFHTDLPTSTEVLEDVAATISKFVSTREAREDRRRREEERQLADAGILPAPIGPPLRVSGEVALFPVEIRPLFMVTIPELPAYGPAAPGAIHALVGLNVRGTVTDRGTVPPREDQFDVQWPDPDCRTIFDDNFQCSSFDTRWEFFSDYMPVDSEELIAPPDFDSNVVIPPGESFDVVLHAVIPDDANLARARLKFGWVPVRDTRPSIPLGDVVGRAW